MDSNKVGALLYSLRREKGMTQKQVADLLNISDKTISKWERGLGFPDVAMLNGLSDVFGVNIEKILDGELKPNQKEIGNLRKTKFYVCPICNSVINSTGDAQVSCCGRRLAPLVAQTSDEAHAVTVDDSEGEYYITFQHEMSKTHYISFVALVTGDKIIIIKLYPEQEAAVRLPKMLGAGLKNKYQALFYYYCSKDGLWVL